MSEKPEDELRDNYDFSNGVRGKYAERFEEGAKMVLLDADIADAFPTAKSVNAALRMLLDQSAQ